MNGKHTTTTEIFVHKKDEFTCSGCISRPRGTYCHLHKMEVKDNNFCINYWWKGDKPRRP